jgi:hypothetical protein
MWGMPRLLLQAKLGSTAIKPGNLGLLTNYKVRPVSGVTALEDLSGPGHRE